MRVLVFGAAGRTGRAVVEQALAEGHDVTAFVHGSGQQASSRMRVALGDATLRADVDAAMHGQEAVINTIGGKTPWRYTALERTAAATIIASMQANQVRRLIFTSMLGIGDSMEHAPIVVRLLVATFLRGAEQDKSAMEKAVASSGLDWTILRPAVLKHASNHSQVKVFKKGTREKAEGISRADLAAFIVDQLVSRSNLQQTLTLAGTSQSGS